MHKEDRKEVFSSLINSFYQDEHLAKYLEPGKLINFAKNIINHVLHEV